MQPQKHLRLNQQFGDRKNGISAGRKTRYYCLHLQWLSNALRRIGLHMPSIAYTYSGVFFATVPSGQIMPVVDIVSLTLIAVTSCISVVQILKEHRHCYRELSKILTYVEKAYDELLSNISTLKETLGVIQEPSHFLQNILKRVQKLCAEISSIHEEFESTSTVAAFFKAPRWMAKLKESVERIELYDLILNNLGSTTTDVSKKNAQDSAHAFLDLLISRSTNVSAVQWLRAEIQGLDKRVMGDGTGEGEIDITEIGKLDPMCELLSSEERSTSYLLFGKLYFEGDHGNPVKDLVLAGRYFSEALEMGRWQAAFYLGEIKYYGLDAPQNFEEAFKLYQVGAKMNDGESLFKVGWCLSCGHGIEPNQVEATEYWKLSYEAGCAKGAEHYGWSLFHGRNVPLNSKKGFRIMMEAKDRGIVDVKLDLAYCYEYGIEVDIRSPSKAFALTKEAYEGGVIWAAKEMGRYFDEGIGVEKDADEAARIYRETFRRGGIESIDARACYGRCLIMGNGAERNVRRGLFHLRKACVAAKSEGWKILGDCYRYGYGVKQNYDTSVTYYNRAIVENWDISNVNLAHLSLGELCDQGVGLSRMQHNSYYYYSFAADRYNVNAAWKVGQMFEEGRGVDVHLDRAFHYFKLSARGGHVEAQGKAGEFTIKGQGVERTRMSTIASIEKAAERGDSRARSIYRKMIRLRLTPKRRSNSL